VNILTVIPARSGSKGVPGKNLRLLGNRPLITYPVRTALDSMHDMRVIVSTDSEDIAAIAGNEGAEVPFLRPAELSGDEVSLIPVGIHAMNYMDTQGWKPDIVISLQATAPFTPTVALDRGISRLLGDQSVDSAISVTLIQTFHPFRAYGLADDDTLLPLTEYTSEHYLQKQDRPPAYGFTGGFYIRRRELLDNWNGKGFALGNKCVGEVVPEHAAVDINTPVDFLLCESILAHKEELEGRA
jgi:CMP-N-acetylneuraminic acid synthetase